MLVSDISGSALFEPLAAGELSLATRVVMAPLTRSRAAQPGNVPQAMNTEYYRQRANPKTGAALIITEATQVSEQGQGYAFTPGIHSPEQVAGWRKITDAVHAERGRILLQLWHVGRISHTELQPNGEQPVAPSAITAKAETFTPTSDGMVPVSEPRALRADEIAGVVEQFRIGAQNAKDAGFDGVEIHGANGYLLDQFLRTGSNRRTDGYGGSLENRMRFCLEVVDAVIGVWGAGRVGYRVSPLGEFNSMNDENPAETFTALAGELGKRGLAYLHANEELADERIEANDRVYAAVREAFKGAGGHAFIACGGYTGDSGAARVAAGEADLIAFGRLMIANPDLTTRIGRGGPFNEPDGSTFYVGAAAGYTDYPTLEQVATS
ncbi:MAG: N-ethylmaleimide reductase [Phycisphaerales bacterium]|jgi:N-ethylmaleimide reductase